MIGCVGHVRGKRRKRERDEERKKREKSEIKKSGGKVYLSVNSFPNRM
jgi:hypothetical protein